MKRYLLPVLFAIALLAPMGHAQEERRDFLSEVAEVGESQDIESRFDFCGTVSSGMTRWSW